MMQQRQKMKSTEKAQYDSEGRTHPVSKSSWQASTAKPTSSNDLVASELPSSETENRLIYTYFNDGKSLAEVVADHGINPKLVEQEFNRHARTNILNNRDVRLSQACIIRSFTREYRRVHGRDEKDGELPLQEYLRIFDSRVFTYDELSDFISKGFDLISKR
jgi:hypothetical protein